MDKQQRPAISYVSLSPGQTAPPLDVQLAEDLRQAERQGLEITGVTGAVSGPLTGVRRVQVARLLEQLRSRGLLTAVEFRGITPADLSFLGRQARTHGFSVTVEPTHVSVTTPQEDTAAGSPAA